MQALPGAVNAVCYCNFTRFSKEFIQQNMLYGACSPCHQPFTINNKLVISPNDELCCHYLHDPCQPLYHHCTSQYYPLLGFGITHSAQTTFTGTYFCYQLSWTQ